METKDKLTELNKAALQHLEEFVKEKKELDKDHHEKLHTAKEEWQLAWNKMMEVLLMLERLEI
ncbi:MAG: hypothetical protein U0X40_03870 [Ferruginibacter sp.]